MNKQRKTSNILNVFQYDESTGAVTLPSTLDLTAPGSSDDSTKAPTTAWVRALISSLGYVTLSTDQTITGLKTIVRSGDVLNFKIGTDNLYALKIVYNQNELVESGEATWSFANTFNNGSGTGITTTPISFFRGVLVTGQRLLSASVNTNLLDYYGNNPSGRYPVYAYNTGVQQFATGVIVGDTAGVVNAATGAIADLPAGVVANFKGRVIGSNAVNNNEFVTLSQLTNTSGAYLPLSGGTLTGPLNGTSATFGSTVQSVGALSAGNAGATTGQIIVESGANAASRRWKLLTSQNVNGDFVIQQSTTQTGSTFSDILGFNATGAATFISSVAAGGDLQLTGINPKIDYPNGSYFRIYETGVGARFQIETTGAATFSGSISNDFSAGGTFAGSFTNSNSTGYGLYIRGGSNVREAILIAHNDGTQNIRLYGDGSATFSSSVTTGGNINVNSDGIFINRSSSGEPYVFFQKSGVNRGSIYGVTGGGLRIFDENDNQVLTITGGNVGIRTNSPNGKLTIKAELSDTTPSLVFRNEIGGPSSAISNFVSAAQTFTVFGTNTFVNSTGNLSRFDSAKESSAIVFDEGLINFITGPTSTTASSKMRIASNGAITTPFNLGKAYYQTSGAGTGTSIVDTGITYDTGDFGGYSRGATYQVVFNGNPNQGGSNAYFAQYVGIIMVYTGWSGSAVTTYIDYTQLAVGNNIGALTLTPRFWNGSSEVSSIGVYTGGYQIRIKISGYNSGYTGGDQTVYLKRIA